MSSTSSTTSTRAAAVAELLVSDELPEELVASNRLWKGKRGITCDQRRAIPGQLQGLRDTFRKRLMDADTDDLTPILIEFWAAIAKVIPLEQHMLTLSLTSAFRERLVLGCQQQQQQHKCEGCGGACALSPQVCGHCRMVAYCSRSCQATHWSATHKAECKGLLQKRLAKEYSVLIHAIGMARARPRAFAQLLRQARLVHVKSLC